MTPGLGRLGAAEMALWLGLLGVERALWLGGFRGRRPNVVLTPVLS
jgi:hypothetical protein